jgi:hypothetical protein
MVGLLFLVSQRFILNQSTAQHDPVAYTKISSYFWGWSVAALCVLEILETGLEQLYPAMPNLYGTGTVSLT